MKCKVCQYCYQTKDKIENTCIICGNVFESVKSKVCHKCSIRKELCSTCGKIC